MRRSMTLLCVGLLAVYAQAETAMGNPIDGPLVVVGAADKLDGKTAAQSATSAALAAGAAAAAAAAAATVAMESGAHVGHEAQKNGKPGARAPKSDESPKAFWNKFSSEEGVQ